MKKSAFKFTNYKEPNLSPFEKLFNIFKELIIHTSGDFDEAIDWLRELDKEYQLTDENYTIDDFIKKWKELMKTCDLNTNIFSYGLTSNDKELIISKVNPERMNNHPVELSRQNLKQIVSEMFYIFS